MTTHPRSSGFFPLIPLCTGFGILILAWVGVLLFDVLDVSGLGSWLYDTLHDRSPERAQVWVILFGEAGPIEMVQWLFLVAAAGLSFHIHGRLSAGGSKSREDARARMFWLIMGIAFLLMLIEDAGNPRHWFRHFFWEFLGDHQGRISEMIYFAALGALPLTALVFFSRPVLRMYKSRWLLLGGFFFYAIAVGGSVTRYYWYEAAGNFLHATVLGETLKEVALGDQGHGFWLMDYLVEESLELIGATLLAAAAAAFLRDYPAFLPAPGRSAPP